MSITNRTDRTRPGPGSEPDRPRTAARHRATSLRGRAVAVATGLAVAIGLGSFGVATSQATETPAAATPTTEAAAPAAAAAAADEKVGPPQKTFVGATAYALGHPSAVPTGANDWACEPSAEHPNPVVLVNGTFENRYMNWAALSPRLKDAGYCVYAPNIGGKEGAFLQGTGDITQSAAQLAAYVDKVRAQTGADEVDLVGHSQGGMMPRYYIKNLGGADKVDKLVALAPSNHGTSLSGLATMAKAVPGAIDLVGKACKSCEQQMTDSDFIKELNAGAETDPGVDYTVLATKTDWVVTPYTSSYLAEAPNVTQSKLQDHCPRELTEHLGISYNQPSMQIVLNALDPAHAQQPRC